MLWNTNRLPRLMLIVTGLLLLLAASRILKLSGLEMHVDEVWSIWQTFGTPADIIRWTPYDWVPLYYLVLGGWKELVGIQPVMLRLLSVFIFLLGCAVLYRVVRRLRSERAAWMALLVYGALGYSLRISTEVRAYSLMLTLLITAFWLTIRYFDHPSRRRAVLLAVILALVLYTYLPGVIGFMMLGVYTLIVYPRRLGRWWLPGLIAAVLAAPVLVDKLFRVSERLSSPTAAVGAVEAFSDYFRQYTVFRYEGHPVLVWVGLALLATGLLLWRWRRWERPTWALLAWAALLPGLLYLVNPLLKMFQQHYAMALMLGLALWLAWGLAYLRRWRYGAAAGALVVLLLVPFHLEYYPGYWRPLLSIFSWLSANVQAGDVFVIDPRCCLTKSYEWDYAAQLYFPQGGLHLVGQPDGYRRVWYVTDETRRSPALDAQVRAGRVERDFIGPAWFFFRLYEAPPDPAGIRFDNGLRFHGVDVLSPDGRQYQRGPFITRRDGETLRFRLWWSVDAPVEADYSVGTYLRWGDGGGVADQVDGPPQTISLTFPPEVPPQETSQWQPGQFYVEERELTLPTDLGARDYRFELALAVYQWWDNTRFSAPGADADRLLKLAMISVPSW